MHPKKHVFDEDNLPIAYVQMFTFFVIQFADIISSKMKCLVSHHFTILLLEW
jgi:hypothetical protein